MTKNLLFTRSGKKVDILNPKPDMIEFEDIVFGLSRHARYSGQTRVPYSVAEHSMYTAMLSPKDYKKEALFHDSAEAYIGDIPSPVKDLIPEYEAIEEGIRKAIFEKFGLDHSKYEAVLEYDMKLRKKEIVTLFEEPDHDNISEEVDMIIYCMPPVQARHEFTLYSELLEII